MDKETFLAQAQLQYEKLMTEKSTLSKQKKEKSWNEVRGKLINFGVDYIGDWEFGLGYLLFTIGYLDYKTINISIKRPLTPKEQEEVESLTLAVAKTKEELRKINATETMSRDKLQKNINLLSIQLFNIEFRRKITLYNKKLNWKTIKTIIKKS